MCDSSNGNGHGAPGDARRVIDHATPDRRRRHFLGGWSIRHRGNGHPPQPAPTAPEHEDT